LASDHSAAAKAAKDVESMIDTRTQVDDHLELLAQELLSYGSLESRIVRRGDAPPYLRVVSKDAPELTEFITCEAAAGGGTVAFMWSWGQEIMGVTLTDKARSVAHVLHVDPNRR
jgi:hypothetical protein